MIAWRVYWVRKKSVFIFLTMILVICIFSQSATYALNMGLLNIKENSSPMIVSLHPDNNTIANDTVVVFYANITDADGDLGNVSLIIETKTWEMFYNATSGYYERAILFEEPGNYTWRVVATDTAGHNVSSEIMVIQLPEDLFRYPMPDYDVIEKYNETSVNVRDNEYIYITWVFRHALYVWFREDAYLAIQATRWIENKTTNQQDYVVEKYTRYEFSYYYEKGNQTLLSAAMVSALWLDMPWAMIDFNNATDVIVSPVETGYSGIYPVIEWNITFCNVTLSFDNKKSYVTVHFINILTVKGDEIELKVGIIYNLTNFKIFRWNSTTGTMEEVEDGYKYTIKMIIIHDVVVMERTDTDLFNVTSILPTKEYENGTAIYEYKNTTISTVHLNNEYLDMNSTSYKIKYADVQIQHVEEGSKYYTHVCYIFDDLTYNDTRTVYLDPKYIYYGKFSESRTIDNKPPEIIVIYPENGSNIMSDNITIKWTAKDDETAIDYFRISIDNNPWITIGRSLSYTISGLTNGDHTIKIMAVDLTGNYRIVTITFSVSVQKTENITHYAIYGTVLTIFIALVLYFVRKRKIRS